MGYFQQEETRHVSATSPDLCAAFGETDTSCIFGLMSSTAARRRSFQFQEGIRIALQLMQSVAFTD